MSVKKAEQLLGDLGFENLLFSVSLDLKVKTELYFLLTMLWLVISNEVGVIGFMPRWVMWLHPALATDRASALANHKASGS